MEHIYDLHYYKSESIPNYDQSQHNVLIFKHNHFKEWFEKTNHLMINLPIR